MTLSLCMITWNEEQNLPIILSLIKPYIDEVCIVDSMSTDRTIFIAEQFNAKIIQCPYDGEGKIGGAAIQRNKSIELASSDWVFVLDGDEFPSPLLCENLKNVIENASSKDFDCVAFSRLNYTSGVLHNEKPGEDLLDMHIRLFKSNLRYAGWHSEGIVGYSKRLDLPEYKILHCKSIDRGIAKHEEHRKWGLPVFPFPTWFQEIFNVRG